MDLNCTALVKQKLSDYDKPNTLHKCTFISLCNNTKFLKKIQRFKIIGSHVGLCEARECVMSKVSRCQRSAMLVVVSKQLRCHRSSKRLTGKTVISDRTSKQPVNTAPLTSLMSSTLQIICNKIMLPCPIKPFCAYQSS